MLVGMRTSPSSPLRIFTFLLIASGSLASTSSAEPRDETERWVPALGGTSGVFGQTANAGVTSSGITYVLTSRTAPNPNTEIVTVTTVTNANLRPPAEGDDVLVTPYVGGTAELMTPGIQALPGRPRFFVRGDVSAAFGTERKVARERTPTSLPDPLPTEPALSEEAVSGIGSETTAEVQPLAINAGAGVAFTLDLFERRIRIKPSVEYSREEIDFTGRVIRAVQLDTGIGFQGGTVQQKPSEFIGVTVRGDESEVFQAVGAGIEVELDTVRAGPFMISLFLAGRGTKILGDTRVEFSSQTTVSAPELIPDPTTATADWEFDKGAWTYGGNVGFRFRWLPE
jgi:hypothetical protein